MHFDFTITGDIQAEDENEARQKLEKALETIDQNAEIDLTEQRDDEEVQETQG